MKGVHMAEPPEQISPVFLAAARRDTAIADFFEAATTLLKKLSPLIDAAIARDIKENKR